MPDYKKGKIYALRSYLTDDVYIGSTCKLLSNRMAGHRYDNKNDINFCRSKIILDFGDAYIELIEDYPCDNKEQLNRREGEIIRNTLNCVNRRIEGRTKNEYREEHKEEQAEYQEKYRKDHKEEQAEYQKQYRELNKEKLAEQKRQYYQANKNK